jgi:hypothetical protein
MSETSAILKALAIYKDHLIVSVSSDPASITPFDVRSVKYIIKDLMDIENKMINELTVKDADTVYME